MVAFQTSEVRLPFWIKALLRRYHESPAYNDEVNREVKINERVTCNL